MNETSRSNTKKKKGINKWKWAFLILFSIILLLVLFFIQLLRPSSIDETKNSIDFVDEDEIEITSAITKEDAEFVMNSYLQTQTQEENISYQMKIEEELSLTSKIKINSLELPLTLVFEPFATEEGNLQLRAESMDLASLSLPVSLVLTILTNQINLPEYVEVDSKEKIILVDFNELRNYYPYGIELERIDLKSNDIQLKLFVNKDTLKRAVDYEKEIQSGSEMDK